MALTSGDSGGNKSSYGMSVIRSVAKPKPANVASPVPSSGTPWAPKPVSQINYAPVQRQAQAPYYGGSVPSPAAYQQQPATPTFGIGTPTNGSYGGGGAPAPAAKPVMSEADWLSGDTDYQDMTRELDTNLADFLKRISTQETQFDDDYKLSEQGFERNKAQGMLSVGEDFTSRGLANSGLFANASSETAGNFERQGNGMRTAKDRTKADFETQRADKQNATRIGKDNSKADSLRRMSMSQAF